MEPAKLRARRSAILDLATLSGDVLWTENNHGRERPRYASEKSRLQNPSSPHHGWRKALNGGRPPGAEAPGSKTIGPRETRSSNPATATPGQPRPPLRTAVSRNPAGPIKEHGPIRNKDRLARETRPSPTTGSAFRGRSPGPLPPPSALGLAGARGAGLALGRRVPATEATPEEPTRTAPKTATSTLLRTLDIVSSNKSAFNKMFSHLFSFLCITFLYLHNLSTSYSHTYKQ